MLLPSPSDAAAEETGLAAIMSFSPPIRARVEAWVTAFASSDAAVAIDAYDGLRATVYDLQAGGYGRRPELLAAVEAVLISLLGHDVTSVREAAIVELNCLYDGHALQREEALHVTIACAGGGGAGAKVSVPLVHGAAVDVALLEARNVVLRMFGPSGGGAPPGWKEFQLVYAEDRGAIECQLAAFKVPGYYDWVVAEPGAMTPVESVGVPVDATRRLKGRFIVQPRGTRDTVITEVPVDEVGAVWDEKTGQLRSRGTFRAVKDMLPAIQRDGANTVYLMGALERPNDDASASPFAVVDRGTPARMLGGGKEFSELIAEMKRLGIRPIVDAFDRVSRTRMHRKYRYLTVETLNARGIPLRHPGTDGRENQWEDTALLNYRRVETWNLFVNEIKSLAKVHGVRGVRLDNAQSLPPILKSNMEELHRADSDGEPHYTLSEIFYGAVVKANEEFGYWTSDAGLERGYPNPFIVKLCREMWNEYPDFMIIAESNFHREPPLLNSGAIAHSIRIPQILASISGKSLRRDGTVARIPVAKRSTAKTLGRLFKNDRAELPKNAILVGCSCTHLSPFPAVLYGRRAWLAVDLMFFLPQLPMSLLGESRGRAYRMNAATVGVQEEESEYDVNFDALLPKSPPKRSGQSSSPAEGSMPSTLSLGGSMSPASRISPSSPVPGIRPLPPAFTSGLASTTPGSEGVTVGGLESLFHSATTTSSKLKTGTLSTGTAPLGGLAASGTANALGSSSGIGLMQMTQQQQDSQLHLKSPRPVPSNGGGLPPQNSGKPRMRRRGSLADLRRTPSSTNLVRSRSRDDMQGGGVKSLTAGEYKRMSAMEEQIRMEIDPASGLDIAQIQGHYTHRLLLRQSMEALRIGSMSPLRVEAHVGDHVFAFARFTDSEIVIIAVNLADGREDESMKNGCDVDIDLRQLWEYLPDCYTNTEEATAFYSVVDSFTGEEHAHDIATLEEIAFRRYHVHINALGIALLNLKKVPKTRENSEEHFAHCIQRLQSQDASDLKDPRENHALASLARGAATSMTAFAEALGNIRSALVHEGCDNDSVLHVLQLCIQRASQLLFMVSYEGVPPPKDFEPPVAERIVAYLTHLSTAARDDSLMEMARSLVSRTTKLGPLVFLSAELGRFSTAGGLGVMVDELTKGLVGLGLEVYVISPYYTVNRKNQKDYLGDGIKWTQNISVNLGTHEVDVGIFQGVEQGVNLIFMERGDFFPKVYADTGGPEKHMQTCVLASLGSLEVCCQLGFVPSVIISNDWLMAMASGYRNFFGPYFNNTTFFHLIHNFGGGSYEGRCYPDVGRQGALEYIHRLPRHLVMNDSWQQKVCNPSRTALMTTDNWGTVSPNYLRELLSGHPLSDLLHMAKSPFGYPNGIRKAEREKALRTHGADSHEEAKEFLQRKYFGFEKGDSTIPLFSFGT